MRLHDLRQQVESLAQQRGGSGQKVRRPQQGLPFVSSNRALSKILRRASGPTRAGRADLDITVARAITDQRGKGSALSPAVRHDMETAFNADLSPVRVHTDRAADELNRAVSARAFTSGNDLFFRQGTYHPTSSAGKTLLAHELTHVVQQRTASSGLPPNTVSRPTDHAEREAAATATSVANDSAAQVAPSVRTRGSMADPRTHLRVLRNGDGKDGNERYPWIGRIRGAYSAALRRTPSKDPEAPHAGTLADLREGEFVDVTGRVGGWLHVRAAVGATEVDGYVSQELVAFNRWDDKPPPTAAGPTLNEALVTLKRAETARLAGLDPSGGNEQAIAALEAALKVVQNQSRYAVEEGTYQVTFASTPGTKIKVSTIEDFILFVEAVEAHYGAASPKEIASEIRQIWFSDVNWDVMVGSVGVSERAGYVDIETEPNPIATRFDMDDLTPKGGKVISTALGDVDIGHVMAGIDARLSGSPTIYPKTYLKAQGRHGAAAKFKYEQLKDFSDGDPSAFATFAGDLGQAYAAFIYDRYEKPDTSAKLRTYVHTYAKPSELLGDLHGYIATAVGKEVRAIGASPTGTRVTVSSILRDLYLVDKPQDFGRVHGYVATVAGKQGKQLKNFLFAQVMSFGHVWYAKLVFDNTPALWNPADLFDEYVREFSERAGNHEMSADRDDTLDGYLDQLLKMSSAELRP